MNINNENEKYNFEEIKKMEIKYCISPIIKTLKLNNNEIINFNLFEDDVDNNSNDICQKDNENQIIYINNSEKNNDNYLFYSSNINVENNCNNMYNYEKYYKNSRNSIFKILLLNSIKK